MDPRSIDIVNYPRVSGLASGKSLHNKKLLGTRSFNYFDSKTEKKNYI